MAEILVVAGNRGNSPRHWKDGDPVVVMPDGHEWGTEELGPKFRIIKQPGVSVSDLLPVLEDGPGNILSRRRRRYRVENDGRAFDKDTNEEWQRP